MNSLHDLTEGDAGTLVRMLNQIIEIADEQATQGIAGGYQLYKIARDAREIMMWDNISRETMRKLSSSVEMFDGYEVTATALGYMRNKQKINAIKEFRTETGLGLKEAKDWVEAYMAHKGWNVY
jgi:ribosomal protein L7/L12